MGACRPHGGGPGSGPGGETSKPGSSGHATCAGLAVRRGRGGATSGADDAPPWLGIACRRARRVTGAVMRPLPDGRRIHFQHGPIDLILEAWGPIAACRAAHDRAFARFAPLLEELVAELPQLRSAATTRCHGPVARRMTTAIAPHRPHFVTPMAAVAGAVADEVLAALTGPGDLARAYVNNGGDIALFLSPGTRLDLALVAGGGLGADAGRIRIGAETAVRGVATSGWRGRSQSLGIADAVTVLARDAAQADVAATLIANAVALPDHPAITHAPANSLDADSDLGARPVTTGVGPLSPEDIATALDAGLAEAARMRSHGLIIDATLFLQGATRQLCQKGPRNA